MLPGNMELHQGAIKKKERKIKERHSDRGYKVAVGSVRHIDVLLIISTYLNWSSKGILRFITTWRTSKSH